jgi:hypothetical protein
MALFAIRGMGHMCVGVWKGIEALYRRVSSGRSIERLVGEERNVGMYYLACKNALDKVYRTCYDTQVVLNDHIRTKIEFRKQQ